MVLVCYYFFLLHTNNFFTNNNNCYSIEQIDTIRRADIRLSDISNMLGDNWPSLAVELGILQSDISIIQSEYPGNTQRQAMVMLRLWLQTFGQQATGNSLEKALRTINREDIVNLCIHNIEIVTDDMEKAVAKVQLDQSGFDSLKEELGPSRDGSLGRKTSLSNHKVFKMNCLIYLFLNELIITFCL